MNKDLETMIRARARALWEEEGCQDGSALRHWLEAERQIMREHDVQRDATATTPDALDDAADRPPSAPADPTASAD